MTESVKKNVENALAKRVVGNTSWPPKKVKFATNRVSFYTILLTSLTGSVYNPDLVRGYWNSELIRYDQ